VYWLFFKRSYAPGLKTILQSMFVNIFSQRLGYKLISKFGADTLNKSNLSAKL